MLGCGHALRRVPCRLPTSAPTARAAIAAGCSVVHCCPGAVAVHAPCRPHFTPVAILATPPPLDSPRSTRPPSTVDLAVYRTHPRSCCASVETFVKVPGQAGVALLVVVPSTGRPAPVITGTLYTDTHTGADWPLFGLVWSQAPGRLGHAPPFHSHQRSRGPEHRGSPPPLCCCCSPRSASALCNARRWIDRSGLQRRIAPRSPPARCTSQPGAPHPPGEALPVGTGTDGCYLEGNTGIFRAVAACNSLLAAIAAAGCVSLVSARRTIHSRTPPPEPEAPPMPSHAIPIPSSTIPTGKPVVW